MSQSTVFVCAKLIHGSQAEHVTEGTRRVGHHTLAHVCIHARLHLCSLEGERVYFQYGSVISRHGATTDKEEKRAKQVFK